MLIDKEGPGKGKIAEEKFMKWLDKNKIPYLYINQDIETFSSAFKEDSSGKRPDFMILIPNIGPLFVDVKYKKISEQGDYPIDFEETRKHSSMQRKFNIPIWFALSNENSAYQTWLWISVSKVLELGVQSKKSSRSGEYFFPIPPEEFIQISHNDSLDRLFSEIFKR